MKRVISLVLALLMVATMFVLASCGKDDPSETSSDTSSEQPKELTKTEAFALAIQNLAEALSAPDAFLGINNPLERSNEGAVSAELKLESVTGGDDNMISQILGSSELSIGINSAAKDGKTETAILLSMFGEVIDLHLISDGTNRFLQLMGVMEKPVLIPAETEESADNEISLPEMPAFNAEEFQADVKKVFDEVFDLEKMLTLEKGEDGKNTFTIKLNASDIRKLIFGVIDAAKKQLGDSIEISADELEIPDDAAVVFVMKTENDFPISMTADMIEKESSSAKIALTFEKKEDSLNAVLTFEDRDGDNENMDKTVEVTYNQTIAGDKLTASMNATIGKDVAKCEMTATKKDGVISYEMSADVTVKAGEGVTVNLDDVVSVKGTLTVSDGVISTEGKLTVSANGIGATISYKFAADAAAIDVKVPTDYDTADSFDFDEFMDKLSEKLPTISSLIEMIMGGDEPDGDDYLYVTEDGLSYLSISTDFSNVYTLSLGADIYDDDGSEFTLFDANGNAFFVIPNEFNGDTATVFGTTMTVDRTIEDYIWWLSDDMDFAYETTVSEKTATLFIRNLKAEGNKFVKTFADGHTESFDFTISEDGTIVTVGGFTFNFFEIPMDWDDDVI